MQNELRRPIILLGNTRSGTSMVQNVLSVHPDVVKWYEPRTLWLCSDPRRIHDEFGESDATDEVKAYIRRRFLRYQKQNGNRIVMEKTPANILKISYVRAIFPDAIYLFIVRNPFSFISSVELKWQRPVSHKGIRRRLKSTPLTQLYLYVGRFLTQRFNKHILRRKYLASWGPRYKGMEQDLKTHDLLTVIARQWAKGSKKAEQDLALFKDGQVLRLKYEEFVTDPVSDMKRVCDHCGLEMTDDIVTAAKNWVKSNRQEKWRRFDLRELARIVPEIRDEMQRHGYEIPMEIAEYVKDMHKEERAITGSSASLPTGLQPAESS